MKETFTSLGITKELSDALKEQHINTPTTVQKQAIPAALKGRDLLVQAQTGTGKTLAFLLPVLQRIKKDTAGEQALIIAPTRELAEQIAAVAASLTPATGAGILSLIGGKTIENQLQKLHRRPQVVIGTPVAKPAPVFVKLDEAIVDQELARYADRLPDDVTGA